MGLTYEKHRDFVLGQGAHSVVYSGTFFGNPVAVKRVEKDRLDQVCQREAEMVKLNHDNVLKLLAVNDEEDFRVFVLELCDGTLTDISKEMFTGRMPSDLEALEQMASGLAYIHDSKFVHRDIKPENILIRLNEGAPASLKISDFGYCKPASMSGKFSLSGIKGTPNFMAPEILKLDKSTDLGQVTGRNAVDIFSMGCVFYFYLAKGKHPFGDCRFTIPSKIISNQVMIETSDLSDKKSSVFCGLIRKMIDKEPDARPAAVDVVNELNRIRRILPSDFE